MALRRSTEEQKSSNQYKTKQRSHGPNKTASATLTNPWHNSRCPGIATAGSRRRRLELHDLLLGLLVHMIVIGLPIAFSVRRFAS